MIFLTNVEERNQTGTDLFDFLCVFLVGVFQFLEGAGCIHIVAWIDAYLFHVLGCYIGHIRVEMHIGYQRSVIALRAEADVDVHHVFGFAHTLSSHAYIFATGIDNALGLFYASFRIECNGVRHTLDADRMSATHRSGANIYFSRLTAGVVE